MEKKIFDDVYQVFVLLNSAWKQCHSKKKFGKSIFWNDSNFRKWIKNKIFIEKFIFLLIAFYIAVSEALMN